MDFTELERDPPVSDEDYDSDDAQEQDPPRMCSVPLKPKSTETYGDDFGSHDGDLDSDGPLSRGVLTVKTDLWSNGEVITYAFMKEGGGTPNQQQRVHNCIKVWEKYANVDFRYIPDPDESTLRIQFTDQSEAWSWVGKEVLRKTDKTRPTMRLGRIADTTERRPNDDGVILHEIGHVLGLKHEHQSPKFGASIKLNEDAVMEYYTQQHKWKREDVISQILQPYADCSLSNYTNLDLNSIMLYPINSAMISDNVSSVDIRPRNNLSPMDKAFIQLNYPYFGPAKGSKKKNPNANPLPFSIALGESGVQADEETQKKMLRHFGNGDWQSIREDLITFFIKARDDPSLKPNLADFSSRGGTRGSRR